VLARVFSVLARAGKFSPAPAAVEAALEGGRIRYKNKIALAMQAKENGALTEFFQVLMPVLQSFPQLGQVLFNAYKPEVLIRDLIRNSGQPERWIASLKEMQKKTEAQAQAMLAQAEAQAQPQMVRGA